MLAVLLALTCAFSYGPSDYAAGLATRRATALTTRRYGAMIQVALAAEIARAIPVVLIVALVSRQHPALPSLAWGATVGITGISGIMALCLAFLDADFSVASPVSAVSAGVFSADPSPPRPAGRAGYGTAQTTVMWPVRPVRTRRSFGRWQRPSSWRPLFSTVTMSGVMPVTR
jgi:hypothetical protein